MQLGSPYEPADLDPRIEWASHTVFKGRTIQSMRRNCTGRGDRTKSQVSKRPVLLETTLGPRFQKGILDLRQAQEGSRGRGIRIVVLKCVQSRVVVSQAPRHVQPVEFVRIWIPYSAEHRRPDLILAPQR